MSDNESNRGKKDNTSPEHKPKHAVNNEKAPSGSLGTNSLKGPTPGGSGSFQSKAQTREGENTGPSKQPIDIRLRAPPFPSTKHPHRHPRTFAKFLLREVRAPPRGA